MTELPRRCYVERQTPVEAAIQKVVDAIEDMGADVRLSDAVFLLGKAKDCLADYVDGVPRKAWFCSWEDYPTKESCDDTKEEP